MNTWGFVLLAIIAISLPISVTSLAFKYLIKKNIIRPSKISRIFYNNDENFIISWKKALNQSN
ncbi:hypothetical protein [Clostridium sp. JS66]|uniref:hypothetical protein n=1 Tax=Clostridium sp. JS66 TaxID=3064705 RepID=UPI00298D705D|nr:hypothetical protein [Clostridium sp. JS66]WPC43839.1 hypothetical protein Q6H37_10285 [Clostridium sp. JS66]